MLKKALKLLESAHKDIQAVIENPDLIDGILPKTLGQIAFAVNYLEGLIEDQDDIEEAFTSAMDNYLVEEGYEKETYDD